MRIRNALLIVAAAAVVAGCQPTVRDLRDPNVLMGDTRPLVVAGEAAPLVRADADTPLRVMVPLRNKTNRPVHLQYRWVWYDASGLPARGGVDPAGTTGWSYVQIEPRSRVPLTGTAPDTDAVRWQVELRKAK